MNRMPHLWALIQAHKDATGVTESKIAERANVSRQTMNSWKKRGSMPSASALKAVAREIRVDYSVALDAVLHDTSYLPEEEVPEHGTRSAQKSRDPLTDADELVDSMEDETRRQLEVRSELDDLPLPQTARSESGTDSDSNSDLDLPSDRPNSDAS